MRSETTMFLPSRCNKPALNHLKEEVTTVQNDQLSQRQPLGSSTATAAACSNSADDDAGEQFNSWSKCSCQRRSLHCLLLKKVSPASRMGQDTAIEMTEAERNCCYQYDLCYNNMPSYIELGNLLLRGWNRPWRTSCGIFAVSSWRA